jgi:hypothetical protein
MPADCTAARREFQDYVEDVIRSRHQTFGDALSRMLAMLSPPQPLGVIAARVLFAPSFDAWYEDLQSRTGGMGGGGDLTWPPDSTERVATQLEVIRRVDDGRLEFWRFCHQFLETSSRYDDMVHAFAQNVVRPFARDFLRLLQDQPEFCEPAAPLSRPSNHDFIDPERMAALRAAPPRPYDLRKLVRLCEELNICFSNECFFAVAMLTRAVIDYVPPVFGYRTFAEVVSNHPRGRSHKAALDHLQNAARAIADLHLHGSANQDIPFPNAAQVNFGPNLDLLLDATIKTLQQRTA